MEEFRGMKRKELQALCKKRGVPANLTNREMADRLSSLFEENKKSVVQGKSNSDGSVERTIETGGKAGVRRNVKKVRFSPVDETFVFVSSHVKCTSREKRATARGSGNKRSLAVEKSRRRVVSVRTVQSPVRATRSRARKVVDKDVPQVFSPGIRKKSRRGGVKVDMNEVQSVDVGDTRPELSDSTNCDNPRVEVAAPLRWHLRSRGVGVEKDGKVEHTTIENTRKNVRPTDFKKRKRNDTEGHLHSDDKPEDGSLAFVRAQQRKTTRHSKRIERRETDSKLSIVESEAVKSVGRITRSRASRVEGASTVKAINEIVEVKGEIEKDVQLGQPPKIIGRRTRKSTAEDKNPPSENDGPEGQISDIFTARIVEKRKTKRMKHNAATGSKSLLLGNELVNAEIAGSKLCFQKVSGLDASAIEAESRKSEVLEEHEEVDCLRHISNGSGKSVSRGKHCPAHKDKERNGLVLENKTRKRTKDTRQKLGASEFGVAVDPVNDLPLRRSRRKAIPSAVLTDKEFIAHSTDRKNVRSSPYNRASEVETSAKEKSLKTLMTNALVHNSRVSSDAPAKQKGGKSPNGEMEYSGPSTEEPRTSRQSKRGTYKSEHGASMNSIVKADAKRQKGSATITEEVGARAKSAEMMDETLNIYVYLDVPAVLEHEDGLEKNGKTDKAECSKNKGSDGKAGDITGINSFDFYGVNIHLRNDLTAQSGNALVSAAEKSQEVDVKWGLEELPSDSVVINEKPRVLIEDDRGKVQDSVNRSCQALGRAEDSIPEQVPSRAQIEDMDAVSHVDASLTLNLDSVDEPSDAPLCLENKPETEHVYIGEHAYSRSVEELILNDHMDECEQRGIAERVPVEADEHAHQIALLDPSSNEEQNQAYEAHEVHVTNLGLQVGTFRTAIEDVVAIQLHNSCSSAPTGTPETLALGSGEANQIKTKSAVISSLQSNGHSGGDRYPSSETEFSSERAQPEQTVIDAEDGLCTPEKTTEEPGRKQRESQEPLESVEAAVAACDVTIDEVAEEKQSADGSFSLLNPTDAKITREKVYEVDEGSFDFASEKPLGTRETSGKDLSMIPLDGCNTPVAKKCFLSYEHPLQKDSEKQGQGQCPLLEECFCTFGEEISNKPAFKSESDLSSMEVGMDYQEKIEEDPATDEDNVVHFGTALTNACDNDLTNKLQVDCTDTCCPDELGSDTDEHKEKSPVMQSFESVFDETGKSCMETINAQAVGLVTSVEGIIAEDKGISSETVALHSPNTSEHEMSSCMNDVSKDNDGYEAGGNLEDEIFSPVIDGNSLGQDNGFVVPNYSSQCLLDANSEENRFQVEEKSFFNSCDVNNIVRPVVETEALIESVLEVISSRKDQVLDMKEVMNESSSQQVFGNLSAEKGAEIDTVTSRVACESFPLDESNALRSCHMKAHGEIKGVLNIACNTEAVTFRECLKEQNVEQCDRFVEEGDSHFSPDQLADKDDIEEAVAQLNCGPEGMVALGKSSVDITQCSNSEFAHFESLEKKGAVISLSLSSDGHKQEELDDGGQQEEIGNKVDKRELTASSNLNFSDNQSANHSENLEMTEALDEGKFDLIEVGNCHLPRAGGEDLNVQKEAVNFHQHCKGSICEVYEVGEEASSATVTIKAVDMINKEEDGSATSVFLQDRVQFHGDESTKIDLDTPIIPGVAAEDPKCNFNEVMRTMLHSDEQKIDPCDDQRGKSLRPDQMVPSEPISADVGIYVGTTESGLILKDIKTDTVQFDDDKLLEETHLDEVSSCMIEAAPNADTHVEIVNTSHEDIIHTEDEPSALIMQENPATFNLEDGSMPAGETTMSLHGMSIGYGWDKTNSVRERLVVHTCDEPNKASDSYAAPPLNVVSFPGEEYPSKANNVDIGTNAKEKSDGDKEEVIVQEAHEPQEDHAVVGNARDFNHSSKACREVAKECARDNEVASVQTDLVLCESSHAKYERIVEDNEESHGSGRLDEPATESRQLSANADSSSDFSLISSIGDPAILENKLLESQVESQTFTSWEMSFVFGDNSVDSVRKLDAEAEEEGDGNGKNADTVEARIAKLEENAPVVALEDSEDHVDHSDAQITTLNETFLKIEENGEDIIRVTDDEYSNDGAPFEYSRDLAHEKKDVTEDHCSNCPATDEITIKSDKESTEQEVSAMIQEYMDREKLEDGSLEVRASCVDSREKELAHVNASDCAPSDVFPIVHDPSDIRKEHLTFSSYANENVELGTKQEKETIIPNSANYTPASVNLSAKLDVAENVRMQQLNLISPMTKSLDVKMEEPGKLINSSMVGRTKARSNFIEKTPKKLLAVSDMKENMPSTKWEQVGSVTASKTTKTRRVLEDLQRKQL
ncbi:uncharacterized protein LOC115681723 isoform X2 [Syzygium oleosum]|uniref:uncharacterized protein LOC115681723 isoform X2 n=1 Tax=Syzygium oleosum TaxID=219896 RepID=UPI0024BA5CDE|nr:uncharacterized protein LOC115681723 isoform X2 [Syzygium oleosum]